MGGPASSYATGSIALRASGALKPHHHSIYYYVNKINKIFKRFRCQRIGFQCPATDSFSVVLTFKIVTIETFVRYVTDG
jgi:hypothetical protein